MKSTILSDAVCEVYRPALPGGALCSFCYAAIKDRVYIVGLKNNTYLENNAIRVDNGLDELRREMPDALKDHMIQADHLRSGKATYGDHMIYGLLVENGGIVWRLSDYKAGVQYSEA